MAFVSLRDGSEAHVKGREEKSTEERMGRVHSTQSKRLGPIRGKRLGHFSFG